MPAKTSLPFNSAFRPLPVTFSKLDVESNSIFSSFDLFTIALAIGWLEFCSTLAASFINSSSEIPYAIISSTSGFPSVIVPVLSNAATSIWPAFSKVSPFLIKIPYSAALPTPTVTAVGVARPNAHGQATTKIEIRQVSENNKEAPNTKYHIKNTTMAIVNITGIK